MARGKLPASEKFFDSGCRFRRLKKEPKGVHFSISVRMPKDGEHDGWWWSAPLKVQLASPNDKAELLSLAATYRDKLTMRAEVPATVSEYIDRWKARRAKLVTGGSLKQSTIDRENTTLKHLTDYAGDEVLADMTAGSIENVYAAMSRDGISMSTRARVNVKLGQLLSQAMRDGVIRDNPMDKVAPEAVPRMPQRDIGRYEERQVTIAEADALMAEIQSEPRDGLHAAVWLSYTMGLRRGECLGLRWSDIDEDNMTMRIERQMTRNGIDTTKTYKSRRTLPLPTPVWRYLKSWRDTQMQLYNKPLPKRDKRGRVTGTRKLKWAPSVYVCTNDDGIGPWKADGNFNRGLRHFFISHNLGEWVMDDEGKRHYHGATLHSLRHTYATALIRDGVDVISAQALLGHAQITTTLQVYADATEDGMREAAIIHAMHVATDIDTGIADDEDVAAFEAWAAEEEEQR